LRKMAYEKEQKRKIFGVGQKKKGVAAGEVQRGYEHVTCRRFRTRTGSASVWAEVDHSNFFLVRCKIRGQKGTLGHLKKGRQKEKLG